MTGFLSFKRGGIAKNMNRIPDCSLILVHLHYRDPKIAHCLEKITGLVGEPRILKHLLNVMSEDS